MRSNGADREREEPIGKNTPLFVTKPSSSCSLDPSTERREKKSRSHNQVSPRPLFMGTMERAWDIVERCMEHGVGKVWRGEIFSSLCRRDNGILRSRDAFQFDSIFSMGKVGWRINQPLLAAAVKVASLEASF